MGWNGISFSTNSMLLSENVLIHFKWILFSYISPSIKSHEYFIFGLSFPHHFPLWHFSSSIFLLGEANKIY